jgi:hypothetical protein
MCDLITPSNRLENVFIVLKRRKSAIQGWDSSIAEKQKSYGETHSTKKVNSKTLIYTPFSPELPQNGSSQLKP